MENNFQEATRGQRFLNYLIDLVSAFLIYFILLTQVAMRFNIIDGLTDRQFKYGFLIALFIYYLVFELLFHRTIGKFFTNTIVVTSDYLEPSTGKIIIRNLCRFIPFEPLSGFVYLWHDSISSTIVIKNNK